MPDDRRLAIQDLADLGEVSRRTVRYYVQEGLLPAPLGLGRGRHYGQQHLDRLLQVKALQAAGRTLDEIRATLNGGKGLSASSPPLPPLRPSLCRHLELAPGVVLQVAGHVPLPSPGRLNELAAWCRRHFSSPSSEE
jgi:DNA-binding transcriptional MerR regulator